MHPGKIVVRRYHERKPGPVWPEEKVRTKWDSPPKTGRESQIGVPKPAK